MANKNALAVTRLTAELEQEKKRAAWEKQEQAKFHLARINQLEAEVARLTGHRPGGAEDRKRATERRVKENRPWKDGK
jgi:hypothetical protein